MRPEVDSTETAEALEEWGAIRGVFVEGAWRSRAEVAFGKEPAHRASTEADGTFAIEVPPDLPSFRLEASAEFGRAEPLQWHELAAPEVAAGLILVLEAAGKVEGTLRGPDGSAARRGRVMIRAAGGGMYGPGWETFECRCDGEGRFEMRGVEPRKYEAVAWGEGLGTGFGPRIDVRAGETERLDLALPGDSWISGTVVDGEGRGVAGAFVVSRRWDESMIHGPAPTPGRVARTDEAGAFRIGSLGAGEHLLAAEFPSLLRSSSTTISVPPLAGSEGVRIVLPKGRSLAGRVVDAEGRPVAGAAVRADTDYASIRKRNRGGRFEQSPQAGKTGADGAFRLAGLAEAPLFLEVSVEGRARASLEDLEAGREDLLVTLRPCGVAGTVREAGKGNPIPRFSVQVVVPVRPGRPWRPVLPRSFDSPDGSFEWTDAGPGLATVSVSAPGFVPASLERIEVKEGEVPRGLEVSLARATEVRGRVVESGSGAPVPGAKVGWSKAGSPRKEFDFRGTATSGPDGAFLLAGVAAGRLRIEVDQGEFLPATIETLEVREGERIDGLEVRLDRAGALEGEAIGPDGSPLAGGGVRALPIHSERVIYGGRGWPAGIDAAGRFRIAGLRPGKYRVQASATRSEEDERDSEPILHAVALVEAGRTTRVDFREPASGKCTVRGRVVRAGKGVAGVSVRIVPPLAGEDPDFARMFEDRFRTTTVEDGSYAIQRVPAGDATLRVEGMSSSPPSFPLRVPDAGELAFDVVLPSGAIEGAVVRARDGSPVAWTQVTIAAIEGSAFRAGATTDEKGRFRAEGIPPGSFRVRVRQAGWQQGRAAGRTSVCASASVGPVVLGEGEVGRADFVLREGGTATVVVTDPEGKPISWATVRIRRTDASEDSPPTLTDGQADQEGIATATGLAAGRYAFLAAAEGFAAVASEERAVAEGEVTEFAVRLRLGTLVQVRMVVDAKAPLLDPAARFRDAQGWEIWAPLDQRRSGANEGFAQTRLVPGEYTLLARAAGYRDAAVPVRVGEESQREVAVQLEREGGPE
jgi:protocatechuate 3,4-dioxygenase beta subunit